MPHVEADSDAGGSTIALPGLRPSELTTGTLFTAIE